MTGPSGKHLETGESIRQEQRLQVAQEIKAALSRLHAMQVTFDQAFRQRLLQRLLDHGERQASALPEILHCKAVPETQCIEHVFERQLGAAYQLAVGAGADAEVIAEQLVVDFVPAAMPRPARPQDFLNEVRLSALALSIYFAGRLTCTPAVASDVLKLLVLDDVLIGLDHANRRE